MNPIRRIVQLHKRRQQDAESFLLKKQQELAACKEEQEQCRAALETYCTEAAEMVRAINARLFGCVVNKQQVDLCNAQLVAISRKRVELESALAQAGKAVDAATQEVADARNAYNRQAARTEKYVEFEKRLDQAAALGLLRKEELELEEIIGAKR